MRRALLVLAVAIPAVVLAAVSAGTGQVVEVNNFNAVVGRSYVNAAQCAGTDPLALEWNIVPSGGSFTAVGTYRIVASDTAPFTQGDNQNFCPEQDELNATPEIHAKSVGSVDVTSAVQQADVSGAAVVAAAALTCDIANEGKVVWVCVHWYDQSSIRVGYASGRFLVQVDAPDAPTGISVAPGDTRLRVRWEASTGADHYVAEATPAGGGATISSASTNGQEVTISGLQNGTLYDVVVVAFSVGGNPGPASAPPVQGTPQPVEDFWDIYAGEGGREQGGCGAGGAGPVALLAVASLLVLRRRK